MGERTWTEIEPQEHSRSDFPVSKKLIHLLRHGSLLREDDGAIEFWRLKEYLQNHFVHSRHWSDEKWKSIMAKGGGNKKIFQYCTDISGTILYLRALQGHSGRNLIDCLELGLWMRASTRSSSCLAAGCNRSGVVLMVGGIVLAVAMCSDCLELGLWMRASTRSSSCLAAGCNRGGVV